MFESLEQRILMAADLLALEIDGANGRVLSSWGLDTFVSTQPVGDLNADGFDDVLVGSPTAIFEDEGDNGAAYIVFGDENLPTVPTFGAFNQLLADEEFPVMEMPEGTGFAIPGYGITGDLARTPLGDTNGDGVDDLALIHFGPAIDGREIFVDVLYGSRDESFDPVVFLADRL